MTGLRGRLPRVLVAAVVAWMLLIPAGAGAQEWPPDQVDEPAPGEGQPLDDPSDPPPPSYSATAQPSASINLTGATWRAARVAKVRAPNRFAGAVKASRRGWAGGSRRVVLASSRGVHASLSASSLAAAVDGPLLLTPPGRLLASVRRELDRLDARRVFVVGAVDERVPRRLRALGYRVERLRGATPQKMAMTVARRAVAAGADNGTAIVVNSGQWRSALAVPALAAAHSFPIVLTGGGHDLLTERVRSLGAQRTFVIGGRDVISDALVANLPDVTRLGGRNAIATVANVARRARSSGLRSRPIVIGARQWADAPAWGVYGGSRAGSVVLATGGPALSRPVTRWMRDVQPRRLMLVNAAAKVPPLAACQLDRGAVRSWYCAEQTLRRQGYHVPHVDGVRDRFSVWAIYAFEKVAGLTANGSFGNREWNRMLDNPRMRVRRPDLPDNHLEINIGKQLVLLVRNGKVRHAIHTSTGKPSTPTIRGTFSVYEKRPYRQSHNQMYYPVFFHGGYAVHGYPSIPLYPASHGCARVYDGNMDFLFPKLFIGMRVATY